MGKSANIKLQFLATSKGLDGAYFEVEFSPEEYERLKSFVEEYGDNMIDLEMQHEDLWDKINYASMVAYEPIVRQFFKDDDVADWDTCDIDWGKWGPSDIEFPVIK